MIWFIGIGIGMSIGDVLMKHWIEQGAGYSGVQFLWYLAALLVYGASLTVFAYQLRVTPLSVATIMPILVNIIVVFCVGTLIFQEKLSVYQFAGAGFSLIALLFLSRG